MHEKQGESKISAISITINYRQARDKKMKNWHFENPFYLA